MDYCNCLSVHAEQNAIISASRDQMIGSTLYLVGWEVHSSRPFYELGDYVKNPEPCSLCKRLIINAGIKEVIVRINKENYSVYNVDLWKNTESIIGGY